MSRASTSDPSIDDAEVDDAGFADRPADVGIDDAGPVNWPPASAKPPICDHGAGGGGLAQRVGLTTELRPTVLAVRCGLWNVLELETPRIPRDIVLIEPSRFSAKSVPKTGWSQQSP